MHSIPDIPDDERKFSDTKNNLQEGSNRHGIFQNLSISSSYHIKRPGTTDIKFNSSDFNEVQVDGISVDEEEIK